jgi:uncharacterized protein YjbI with pentapeptide repeats|tara:strand:- start:102 stop:875 length:774 start_codon:yes stop_codon:yes gene_type:complete
MTNNTQVLNLLRLLASPDEDRRNQGLMLLETLGMPWFRQASGGDLSGWRKAVRGVAKAYPLNLRGLNFDGFDFSDSVLNDIDFSEGSFVGCKFDQCKMYTTNFSHANLVDADLYLSRMIKVNFSEANLVGASFFRVKGWYVNFQHADLTDSTFVMSKWVGSDFRNAIFRNVNFRSAMTAKSNFIGTDVSGAIFNAGPHAGLTETTEIRNPKWGAGPQGGKMTQWPPGWELKVLDTSLMPSHPNYPERIYSLTYTGSQ